MNKSLQEALQTLLITFGDTVLQDGNKLIGTIADFAPDNLKERKMINIVIFENIPSKLLEIKNDNITVQELKINRCIDKLEDEYGMKREMAEKILSYFTVALDYGEIKDGTLQKLPSKEIVYCNKYFDSLSIEDCIKLGENNNIKTQVYLGNQYLKGRRVKQNEIQAIYWFEKASKQNDLVALCNLAIIRLSNKRKQENASLIK